MLVIASSSNQERTARFIIIIISLGPFHSIRTSTISTSSDASPETGRASFGHRSRLANKSTHFRIYLRADRVAVSSNSAQDLENLGRLTAGWLLPPVFRPSGYFGFFKAGSETVKEISFDGGPSLPAAL